MPVVKANDIDIEYETIGESSGRPLILIMGLASQLVHWPEEFCRKLADQGHFVIRFDNRDAGLSSKMEDGGLPDLMKAMEAYQQGQPVEAPYTLSDMAADTVGLMDALQIDRAHICGLSMGGMIAQVMACEHPQRIRSIVCLSSSIGDPTLPPATPEAMDAMMSTPPPDRAAYLEYSAGVYRAFAAGSDKYDEELQKEISGVAYDRLLYPAGFIRQLAAIWASGHRQKALAEVRIPTLVIHGTHDALVSVAHGRATADAIPGAKLLVVEGLGHGVSYPALWDEIVAAIAEHTARRP
jgi:pimeloyl-ACP methyl ester carboxylesterase